MLDPLAVDEKLPRAVGIGALRFRILAVVDNAGAGAFAAVWSSGFHTICTACFEYANTRTHCIASSNVMRVMRRV